MSKIGKKPIEIPEGVSVAIKGNSVEVSGPKGTLSYAVEKGVNVKMSEGKLIASLQTGEVKLTALHGLTRAILANMMTGVAGGFEKKLELVGVGFRAVAVSDELTLSLGFSHPVKIKAPSGITFATSEAKTGSGAVVTITGIDKQLVGQVAAKIRSIKPPEPYKGKGIRYLGEKIRKKAGKAAKTVGAAGAK